MWTMKHNLLFYAPLCHGYCCEFIVDLFLFVKIANPTVMEPRGISFLRPVWQMITETWLLGLNESDVDVYYTKYINNFKRALPAGEQSIEQAVDDRLTPGENKIKF